MTSELRSIWYGDPSVRGATGRAHSSVHGQRSTRIGKPETLFEYTVSSDVAAMSFSLMIMSLSDSREEFAGTLTGDYVDHGDPPWRWYLLAELVRAPEGYPGEAVWCESGSLFILDRPEKRA